MTQVWDILDKHMTKEELIHDQRWVNLYPSEASVKVINKYGEEEVKGTCQRKAWLRFKVAEQLNKSVSADIAVLQLGTDTVSIAPERKEPRREWIFEEGRRIESTILDVATRAGIFESGHKKFLVPIGNDLNLVGELDGILRINGDLVGIEVKSVSGYNAEKDVFGTPSARRNSAKGEPKIQHLLQTAIYAWHYRERIPCFKILYFMRGNCLRTEFSVTVEEDIDTNDFHIIVDGKDTGLTINQIIARYKELSDKLESNEFPPREFELSYSDEQMQKLSERKELNKTLKEQWDKYWDRKTNGGRQIKRPEHGEFECIFCPYQDVCYDKTRTPIEYNTVLHDDVASETEVHVSLRSEDSGGSSSPV